MSFRTGYSLLVGLFFGMCMGASNSVAILLSLTSVDGKVCYDEISVLDKICCVIVFGFMLFRKGIGCYFFFFFPMTLMLCPLSAPSSPFTHSLVLYLEGSFSSVTTWGKQVFSRVVSVNSLPYPPVAEHYYLEIYTFSDLSNPTRYLHKSMRNNRVNNSPSFSNVLFLLVRNLGVSWWQNGFPTVSKLGVAEQSLEHILSVLKKTLFNTSEHRGKKHFSI